MAAGTTLLQGCPVCQTRASGGHSRAFKLQRHAASIKSYSGLHPSRKAELTQEAASTCCRSVQARLHVESASVPVHTVGMLEHMSTSDRLLVLQDNKQKMRQQAYRQCNSSGSPNRGDSRRVPQGGTVADP